MDGGALQGTATGSGQLTSFPFSQPKAVGPIPWMVAGRACGLCAGWAAGARRLVVKLALIAALLSLAVVAGRCRMANRRTSWGTVHMKLRCKVPDYRAP